MRNFDADTEYIIKPCVVGYGVYNKPYWFNGRRCEGLYMTAKTKEECIEAVIACGAKYTLEEAE